MKQFDPNKHDPSKFSCTTAGMETKKDLWSKKCGQGCGLAKASDCFWNTGSLGPCVCNPIDIFG